MTSHALIAAEYTLTDKGYLIVENRCNIDSINGKQSYIKGKAFVKKNSDNAKLKVQFLFPFRAKYWSVYFCVLAPTICCRISI